MSPADADRRRPSRLPRGRSSASWPTSPPEERDDLLEEVEASLLGGRGDDPAARLGPPAALRRRAARVRRPAAGAAAPAPRRAPPPGRRCQARSRGCGPRCGAARASWRRSGGSPAPCVAARAARRSSARQDYARQTIVAATARSASSRVASRSALRRSLGRRRRSRCAGCASPSTSAWSCCLTRPELVVTASAPGRSARVVQSTAPPPRRPRRSTACRCATSTPYDRKGRLLHDVRLYDQNGLPLNIGARRDRPEPPPRRRTQERPAACSTRSPSATSTPAPARSPTPTPPGRASRPSRWASRSLHRPDPVGRVQRRHLVGLGERRVVEDRGDEEVERLRSRTPSPPGRCARARSRPCRARARRGSAVLGGHEQLQHPVAVAGDHAAGELAPAGDPRARRARRRRSAPPRCGRPSPARGSRRRRSGSGPAARHGLVERVQRGDPALLHRRRGQPGAAGAVADGEDVRDGGAVALVDLDPAALVGLQAGLVEPELAVSPWRPVA